MLFTFHHRKKTKKEKRKKERQSGCAFKVALVVPLVAEASSTGTVRRWDICQLMTQLGNTCRRHVLSLPPDGSYCTLPNDDGLTVRTRVFTWPLSLVFLQDIFVSNVQVSGCVKQEPNCCPWWWWWCCYRLTHSSLTTTSVTIADDGNNWNEQDTQRQNGKQGGPVSLSTTQ